MVCKNRDEAKKKFRRLYLPKRVGGPGASQYRYVEKPDGTYRSLTNEEIAKKGGVSY